MRTLYLWLAVLGTVVPKRPWLYILLNASIGLSRAFPAYLYARERGGVS